MDQVDWKVYISNYPDLSHLKTELEAIRHYNRFGKNEGRLFNHDIKDPKASFRKICNFNLDYIKCFKLNPIKIDSELEAVLIEYRCLPHCEFLIRNAILKLKSDWSFTVICGNNNYTFFKEMCEKIDPMIKVIKTDYDNLDQNSYNNLMLSPELWNLLTGKKILIYQEDSFIFKSGIEEFLKYDYIGAPWLPHQEDNKNCVGNGGFSLRTRERILYLTNNKVEIKYNPSTISYKNGAKLENFPEDVYFSKAMIDFNLGNVADFETAKRFSVERLYHPSPLGGHNFWLSDPHWKNKLIVQFKRLGKLNFEHRGGWNTVINYFENHNFYNEESDYLFLDLIESYFLWNKRFICESKWSGIIHCTPKTPEHLKSVNIKYLFENKNFIKSLDTCFLLITTTEYIKKYVLLKLKEMNKIVNVVVIKHPIDDHGIPFDLNKFHENGSKKIIQIGQQLRIVSSIYLLKIPDNYSKLFLTGTKNMVNINKLLNIENSQIKLNDIPVRYTDTFEEYDDLLSKNVVFIHLYDASANNTILECIIRNTPIIVNKIEPVVEYLGEDYPLYFNELHEVPELLNKVEEAHLYLKNMDKSEFDIKYFYNRLLTSVNLSFHGESIVD